MKLFIAIFFSFFLYYSTSALNFITSYRFVLFCFALSFLLFVNKPF